MALLVKNVYIPSNNNPNPNHNPNPKPNLNITKWIQGTRKVQRRLFLSPKINKFAI